MVEVRGVEGVYERLFLAQDTKDVEIAMSDGTAWAHSVILAANSEAITGMLKHGTALEKKKLDWTEHPVAVGQFVLRLMYTGTVVSSDWSSLLEEEGKEDDSEKKNLEEIPLKVLLGGLAITKVYMVPHLLEAFTKAVGSRLSAGTFDTICAAAVRHDVTALRLRCLQAVCGGLGCEGSLIVQGCGATRFNGRYCPEGMQNNRTKYRMADGSRHTIAWSGGFWYLCENYTGNWYTVQADTEEPPACSWVVGGEGCASAPSISHRLLGPIKRLYDQSSLAPEVMAELAPVFGAEELETKPRRTL